MFNSIINNKELKELELTGRKFTWSNNQEIPLMAKFDRILVSTEWESVFPLVTVRSFPRIISDHTALIMDTCCEEVKVTKLFRFEL